MDERPAALTREEFDANPFDLVAVGVFATIRLSQQIDHLVDRLENLESLLMNRTNG